MNLMVFDSHMPNADKYFIVMDQFSNPFCSNGAAICSAGAFMLLIILWDLEENGSTGGQWKIFSVRVERLDLWWKYKSGHV